MVVMQNFLENSNIKYPLISQESAVLKSYADRYSLRNPKSKSTHDPHPCGGLFLFSVCPCGSV